MADFNSKYTGEQVEQLLDQVASGNAGSGGGGIIVETDPVFSASPAATITEEKKAEWNGKQDAISDISAIREGAALGATALQEHQDISHLATKQEVSDIVGDINTILESIINGGIITFTIEEVEFRGETGMTWKEWLLTDYNTYNFTESGGGYIDIGRDTITYGLADIYVLGYSDGTMVGLNDKVINKYPYIITEN